MTLGSLYFTFSCFHQRNGDPGELGTRVSRLPVTSVLELASQCSLKCVIFTPLQSYHFSF